MGAEAFTDRLKKTYSEGKFSKQGLSDRVRRIPRSVFAVGIDEWKIADGTHRVAVGKSATDPVLTGETRLTARQFGR